MNKITTSVAVLFLLTGCRVDKAYYQALYQQKCAEGRGVVIETLTPTMTCNGLPLVMALANEPNIIKPEDLQDVLTVLFGQSGFDPNIREIATGRPALIVAYEKGNFAFAAGLLRFADWSQVDLEGRNFLHVLALHPAPGMQIPMPPQNLDALKVLSVNPSWKGVSALKAALDKRNFALIWRLISFTNRVADYWPNPTDASFFFDPQVERFQSTLDSVGGLALAPYSGPMWHDRGGRLESRAVSNYSLVHFAAENGLSQLLEYLIRRGADLNAVSSVGAPLTAALKNHARWKTVDERAAFERTVSRLMLERSAVSAPGVLSAAIFCGKIDWVQTILRAGAEIASGEDLVFMRDNPLLPDLFVKAYRSAPETERRNLKAKIKYQLDNESSANLKKNPLGQSYAHLFAYLVPPKDYETLAGGGWRSGFHAFVSTARDNGLLDAPDELRMIPLHYWLLNAARKQAADRKAERRDLERLLKHSEGYMTLNINNDSALSLAVRTGKADLVEEMLDEKHDMSQLINVPNQQGKTPLDYAKDLKMRGTYDFLKSYL